jgi:hypothetical protein
MIDSYPEFLAWRESMTKKIQIFTALLCTVLFTLVTVAQEPVLDIDAKVHPNLYDAQKHVVEANHAIELAQKDNRFDMQGHAEKARQLLAQVNQELKAAAEAASAAAKKH